MIKALAAIALGGALVLGALASPAGAATKGYDDWTGSKKWESSYGVKVRYLTRVAPSSYDDSQKYADRDGRNANGLKGKNPVFFFRAYDLYRDDGVPKGKKVKLIGFDALSGIQKFYAFKSKGQVYYAAVLKQGYRKGHAFVRWQVGKNYTYTTALRIFASPNGKKHSKPIDPKKFEQALVMASAGGGGGAGRSCFASPLSKIGVSSPSACVSE